MGTFPGIGTTTAGEATGGLLIKLATGKSSCGPNLRTPGLIGGGLTSAAAATTGKGIGRGRGGCTGTDTGAGGVGVGVGGGVGTRVTRRSAGEGTGVAAGVTTSAFSSFLGVLGSCGLSGDLTGPAGLGASVLDSSFSDMEATSLDSSSSIAP